MFKKRKNNTESSSKISKKRKNNTEDGPLPITGHPNHPVMSAGIKFYQESAENNGSVKVNPSGLKGLKNQKLGVESNYQESASKVSIKILGDFKIYERLKYHRPFRVLFDTLFLEGYLLPGGNYAVETIKDFVGGPCIFLFTNCVLRNITQKRLGIHLTGLTTELYHCKDSIDYRRTDFDCLKEVFKEDGINERLILATGDEKLKRLMRKISAVPILYLSNNEKPKSRQGAPDFQVKDEVMPHELLFELHHTKRNIMNMLKEADFKDSESETVKVFLDEGFIRRMLLHYQVFLDEEFICHISKLLGRQVALISTRCASNHKVASPHIGYVMCGHTKRRPLRDDCVMSVVETPEYGIHYVATTSNILKERLSKMRFITIISFQGSKMILHEPKASVESVEFDIEETTTEDTLLVSKKRNLESNKNDDKGRSISKRRKLGNGEGVEMVKKRKMAHKEEKLLLSDKGLSTAAKEPAESMFAAKEPAKHRRGNNASEGLVQRNGERVGMAKKGKMARKEEKLLLSDKGLSTAAKEPAESMFAAKEPAKRRRGNNASEGLVQGNGERVGMAKKGKMARKEEKLLLSDKGLSTATKEPAERMFAAKEPAKHKRGKCK